MAISSSKVYTGWIRAILLLESCLIGDFLRGERLLVLLELVGEAGPFSGELELLCFFDKLFRGETDGLWREGDALILICGI